MRRVLALVPLVAALAASLAFVESGRRSEAVEPCAPLLLTAMESPAFDDCVLGMFEGAGVDEAAPAVLRMDALAERFPTVDVYTACHRGAHLVGERWASSAGSSPPEDILHLALVGNVCNGGFMHGIQVGWSRAAQAEGSAGRMADACVRMRELAFADGGEDPSGLCADGFGHALWLLSGRDVGAALDGCDLLSEMTLVGLCYLGVGMQLEEEAVGSGGWGEAAAASADEFAPACAARSGASAEACARTAGLVFGVPSALAAGFPRTPAGPLPPGQARAAVTACGGVSVPSACFDELVLRMSQRLEYTRELMLVWCDEVAEVCAGRYPQG